MTKKTVSIMDLFAKVSELELMGEQQEIGKTPGGQPIYEFVNPTGVKLKVVGTDSKQYREAERKMLPYAGKKLTDLKPEELEKIAALKRDMVVSFIVGWDNDEAFGAPYSPEYAKELFTKPEANMIMEQVEAFAQERANFFRPSKK
jgi:hypothetical protein